MKRADLGNYQEKQTDLELVKYIKEETGGETRRAIKEKIEWGKHWNVSATLTVSHSVVAAALEVASVGTTLKVVSGWERDAVGG